MPPDTTTSPPSYQLPPVPEKPPVRRTGIIIAGVVVLLLVIAAVVYFFTPVGKSIQIFLMPISIPQELRTAGFLSDHGTSNTVVYHFPASGQTMTDAGGVLISAAQNGKGTARITRSADGTFVVSMDTITVLQDKTPRTNIDVAPDGRSIVFAVASSTSATIPSASASSLPISRTAWNVVLYLPATHSTIMLGAGVSPFFVDQSHIAWIAPAGLALADLMTGTSAVLVPDTTGHVSSQMLVSPDHTIVAWYAPGAGMLLPYKVSASGATALTKTTLPSPSRSVTLGNDSFYILRTAGTETEILKQAFGQQAVHAGDIPSSLDIRRLVLGTL